MEKDSIRWPRYVAESATILCHPDRAAGRALRESDRCDRSGHAAQVARLARVERAQEGGDDGRVELRARSGLELGARGALSECRPVAAVGGHRLVGVGDREDASLEWDLVAAQFVRVPEPVGALVVREDPRAEVLELRSREEARAD